MSILRGAEPIAAHTRFMQGVPNLSTLTVRTLSRCHGTRVCAGSRFAENPLRQLLVSFSALVYSRIFARFAKKNCSDADKQSGALDRSQSHNMHSGIFGQRC